MSGNDTEHESFIKTPQQLIVVCLLAFVVPVVMIIMLAKFVISASSTESSEASAEAVVARIKPVAAITLTAAGAGGFREGEDIVKGACAACHTTGAAGAPKTGDKAAWGARISAGLNGLVQNAIKGKGGMPPKGGSTDLSDYEIARAVVYLANQSGASFKEPPPPKPAAAKK